MSIEDQIKWDKKYQNTPKLLEDREAGAKLKEMIKFATGKQALDVACGAGKNSIFLSKLGFEVDAMDISKVALDSLNSKNINNITTHLVDLEVFQPKENHYDVIIKTNYLDRDLIPHLIQALKKDGILFLETYMHHEENEKPPSNPAFLLQTNELKTFFEKGFELLDYDEFFNEPHELYKMRKQSITVRKK